MKVIAKEIPRGKDITRQMKVYSGELISIDDGYAYIMDERLQKVSLTWYIIKEVQDD